MNSIVYSVFSESEYISRLFFNAPLGFNSTAGEEKVILFNLSGHGLIDMPSYEAFIKGDLQNYTVTDEMIAENLAELDKQ